MDDAEFEHMLNASPALPPSTGPASLSAAEILRDFLGPKGVLGASLFFHAEVEGVEESEEYDEEYQETEPIEDPQSPSESVQLLPTSNDVGQPTATDGNPMSTTRTTVDEAPAKETSREENPALEEVPGGGSTVEGAPPIALELRVVTKTRRVVRKIHSTKKRCRVAQGNLPDSAERVVYFVKNTTGEVTKPLSASDHNSMILAMEYGCLAGDCLTNLSAVMKEVFTPLLDNQLGLRLTAVAVVGGDMVSSEVTTAPQDAPKVGDALRNEFRANLQKFESQVSHATQQVKGDIYLSVPNINIDDPEFGNDFEAVSMLEGAMDDWSKLIASVVEAENLKRVKGKGPMAEIEFWRRRNASLSALYEQINMPKVRSQWCC